ncbi:hypothetical protein PTI97_01215 [Exiguobacterium marinum]|uniref:Uncharacterized protein n=1 Tax=Exiguobacterium marinum TaxID=273528 RepID=A0ABY7X2I7_9BACL|nr:hypothetical protein [Exiguobacterium marinum]WDH76185.1 hypothetical protein PTI97_01215 [Exiguobacterium marinum]
MDVFGTLIWIGILINPFLAYQTGVKSLYRITLISFTVFLVTWGYAVTGGVVPVLFDTAWNVLLAAYIGLLVLNSYLVSKRFVPKMTWIRFGVIALIGFGVSQAWLGMSTGEWTRSFFMDGDFWMMSVIVSLLLLLLVTLKTLDRRVEA